ncbi:MAG: hypothetical protein KAX49_17980 [Halanaerobiales bacterium]|nr:hypothetical protein [Halanaerobiales bacterium]
MVLAFYASIAEELSQALADETKTIINLVDGEYDLSAEIKVVNGSKVLKSESNALVYLNLDQDLVNINYQDQVILKTLVVGNLTVNSLKTLSLETIIEGDLNLTGGTLNLADQKLEVQGNLNHSGGFL